MALLCESVENQPCGTCRSCQLFAAETHPDLHAITSEAMLNSIEPPMIAYSQRFLDDESARSKRKKVRTTILISQVRALIDQANTASHISRNKVLLIAPVDAMTDSASNSLLKILEEPADNNYFILVTENAQNLLPTIASRCQTIRLVEPDHEQSAQWLSEQGLEPEQIELILSSHRQPLSGLRMLKNNSLANAGKLTDPVLSMIQSSRNKDILALLESVSDVGESEYLLTLQQLLVDLIKSGMNPDSNLKVMGADSGKISQSLDVQKMFLLYDHIGKIRQEIKDGSLDRNLAMEDVLLAFKGIRKRKI